MSTVLYQEELTLIPASFTHTACEACTSRVALTERKGVDEDGETYYNVLCGFHRSLEVA